MARQSNGNYLQPANTSAVSGATISSTAFNSLITDIGTEITNSVDRGGRSAMTANLPMGGNKVTGAADPTVATDLTTKNYVDTTTAAFFSTGDVKLTLKNVADSGWLMCNDNTIGNAGSSGFYANANAQNLFTLLFNNIGTDAYAPIFTAGGAATTRAAQTNAATAWAAGCSISLTKMLGRSLAISGNGSGLSSRPLGLNTGAETVTLAQNQLPNVTLAYSNSISVTSSITYVQSTNAPVVFAYASGGNGGIDLPAGATTNISQVTATGTSSGNTASINGGVSQQAVSIMSPVSYLNAMIKL